MKNKKLIKSALLVIVVVALLGFLKPNEFEAYQIGDKVENFILPNIDGQKVALADYKNQNGVIVIFTCNTCPYAVAYEDRIIALHQKFSKEGYPVLAINPNDPDVQPGDSFEEMKKRAEQKGFTFPYVLDQGQKIYPKFGATKTPHVFLLNNESGDFVLRYIGAIDDNYKDASNVKMHFLADAIEALQNGNPIKMNETKAIGCTIKTK